MGTGAARTTLPMIVADELEADWARVRIKQSPGDEENYGNQDTDGSRSVRHFIQPMRLCGASARMMLRAGCGEALGREGRPKSRRRTTRSSMRRPGAQARLRRGRGGGGGAADACGRTRCKLKEPSAFRYIGKGNVPIVDLMDITTGHAIYGQDIRLDGMKYAVVARPPVVGGKVVSFDAAEAMKVPGVEKVVKLDGTPAPAKFNPLGGVAVIAKNTWAALKGRDALKIVWDDGPNKSYDSKAYKAMLEEQVRKPGKVERNDGDADAALKSAARVITAEYYAPHLAHATMEPPAAVARQQNGKWEVWAPVQSPGGARDDIAKALGIKPEEMVVHTHAARRRLRPQVEVRLRDRSGVAVARHRAARRVKVVWTREDDLRHGFYHTVTVDRFEAGLDASNKVVAWRHRSAAPTHPVHLRARSEASLRHRARHGMGRHAVQRAEHPHGKRRGARATRASAGSAR